MTRTKSIEKKEPFLVSWWNIAMCSLGFRVSIIKVNGKTSGFEPGDESEHLVLPKKSLPFG